MANATLKHGQIQFVLKNKKQTPTLHKKMRFSNKDFFSKSPSGFGHIYRRNLYWKIIFGPVPFILKVKFIANLERLYYIYYIYNILIYLVTRSWLRYTLAPDLLESSHLYYVHTMHRNCNHSVLAYLVYHLKDGKGGQD